MRAVVQRVTRASVTIDDTVVGQIAQGLLVLVGDKAQILPQLEGLDLPAPVELTVDGDPLGNGK